MQFLRELKKLFVGPVQVGRYLRMCGPYFLALLSTVPLRADVTGSIAGYVRPGDIRAELRQLKLHSPQISAERRARDITYLLAYTYAKSLDNVGAKWDPRDPSRAYGQSTWDMRHNFVASYSWALPFDRFLGSNRATVGWRLTGISRFNTGFPVSLKSSGDVALTNIGLDYPNQVAPLEKLNPRSASHAFFNSSAFANDLSCGYEDCGVTGSAKQYLFHGPGTINTDAGVEKDTKVTERTAINLRIEFFNVFNHANFLSNSVTGDANSSQFGQVTNTAPGRIGQISGKFVF